MSNISLLNPYSSAASSSIGNVLNSSNPDEALSYSSDQVNISDEAIELIEELRYKENMTRITTDNQLYFDRVSKKLPATEEFSDMLNWLSSQKEEDTFTLNGDADIANRDVYEKDPEKYAQLWNNMYNHFGELMESLGLDNDDTMMREVLSNDDVQLELMTRFTKSFSAETNTLLSYFNIVV